MKTTMISISSNGLPKKIDKVGKGGFGRPFFMLLPLVYNRAAQIPYELSNIECWRYLQSTQRFAFEKNSQKPLYLLNSSLS
jgi:hypothetical protein